MKPFLSQSFFYSVFLCSISMNPVMGMTFTVWSEYDAWYIDKIRKDLDSFLSNISSAFLYSYASKSKNVSNLPTLAG